jgi:hypothetical protein
MSHIRTKRHNRHLHHISPNQQPVYFFSAVHRTFSKIDHILGYKASLNKFKKTEITSCIISEHNGRELDLNYKRNYRKYSNTWNLNNTWLKDQWVMKKYRDIKKILRFLEFNKNENTTYQNLWDTAKVMLRGKFIAIIAYIKKTQK